MQVNCPTCQKSVEWNTDAEFRPFCSKKCQLIDLGDWATESNAIAGTPTQSITPHMDEEALVEQYSKLNSGLFKE